MSGPVGGSGTMSANHMTVEADHGCKSASAHMTGGMMSGGGAMSASAMSSGNHMSGGMMAGNAHMAAAQSGCSRKAGK